MGAHSRAIVTDYVTFGSFVNNEIPNGIVNGSNNIFILNQVPVNSDFQVYLNGLLQRPGSGNDYQIFGSTITFSKAPRTGSEVLVHYLIP